MIALLLRLIIAIAVAYAIGYYVVTHLAGSDNTTLINSHVIAAVMAILLTHWISGTAGSKPSGNTGQKSKGTAKNGRQQGEVKWFNGGKGFGFISYGNDEEIFVHFRSLRKGSKRLSPGKAVEFTIGSGKKGAEAEDVLVLS